MRVVAISTVKNESDIIEPFVRHTTAVADHLIVMDNASTDGTREILQSLEKEGLPLSILDDPTVGKYQSRRLTHLMREHAVARLGADWVLPLDADEFVTPLGDMPLVPDTANDRALALPWRTYVPSESDDSSELNPVARIRRRLSCEAHPWTKVLIPRKIAALPNAALKQGNHEILVDAQPCPPTVADETSIAHFPIRGHGQYVAKVAVTALQYLAMPDGEADWGWHYREPFAELKRDPREFLTTFRHAAERYAVPPGVQFTPVTIDDPIDYRGGALKYTAAGDDSSRALLSVIHHAADLAGKFAVLTASFSNQDHGTLASFAAQRTLLQAQLAQQDDAIRRLQVQLDRCQQQLDEQRRLLQDPAYRAEHVADAIRRSWTWRVGRWVVGPLGFLKRVLHLDASPDILPESSELRGGVIKG
jgi:hypothetical protein